jgi:hypothetical protein
MCETVFALGVATMQVMLEPEFSVLTDLNTRPLPVALAQRLVNARSGDPYLETFHRLYESLATLDRTRCQAEMARQSRLAASHAAPCIAWA